MGRKRHINEFMRTQLGGGGRAAGHGMFYDVYDQYGDEDWPDRDHTRGTIQVRLPSDALSEKEKAALSGPVITYKLEEVLRND